MDKMKYSDLIKMYKEVIPSTAEHLNELFDYVEYDYRGAWGFVDTNFMMSVIDKLGWKCYVAIDEVDYNYIYYSKGNAEDPIVYGGAEMSPLLFDVIKHLKPEFFEDADDCEDYTRLLLMAVHFASHEHPITIPSYCKPATIETLAKDGEISDNAAKTILDFIETTYHEVYVTNDIMPPLYYLASVNEDGQHVVDGIFNGVPDLARQAVSMSMKYRPFSGMTYDVETIIGVFKAVLGTFASNDPDNEYDVNDLICETDDTKIVTVSEIEIANDGLTHIPDEDSLVGLFSYGDDNITRDLSDEDSRFIYSLMFKIGGNWFYENESVVDHCYVKYYHYVNGELVKTCDTVLDLVQYIMTSIDTTDYVNQKKLLKIQADIYDEYESWCTMYDDDDDDDLNY